LSTVSDLIRKIDFFEPLDGRIINKIAQACIPREYSTGDHVVRQGDPGLGLYFITGGRVKVEIDRDGVKTLVAELQAGDFVGELSIIDQKPRSANVVCLTDTNCLLLTRDTFLKLLKKYPEVAVSMAKALAARLRNTDEHVGLPMVVAPPPPALTPRVVELAVDQQEPRSDLQKVKDLLTDLAGYIFLLKPIMRTSLAVVGCPVTVSLATAASESVSTAIGQLKLVALPACEDHVIGIHGFAAGNFTATVFAPVNKEQFTGISVHRFRGAIRRNESLWLHVPRSGPHRVDGFRLAGNERVARFEGPLAGGDMRGIGDLLDCLRP
jgi:CRP/FNR family cyclic AMP-dependent transcriptional regulator